MLLVSTFTTQTSFLFSGLIMATEIHGHKDPQTETPVTVGDEPVEMGSGGWIKAFHAVLSCLSLICRWTGASEGCCLQSGGGAGAGRCMNMGVSCLALSLGFTVYLCVTLASRFTFLCLCKLVVMMVSPPLGLLWRLNKTLYGMG